MFARISHHIHDHLMLMKENAVENPRKTIAFVIVLAICLATFVSLNFSLIFQSVLSASFAARGEATGSVGSDVVLASADTSRVPSSMGSVKRPMAVIIYDGRGFENMRLAININDGLKSLGVTSDRIRFLPNIPTDSVSHERAPEVFLRDQEFVVETEAGEVRLTAESYSDLMRKYVQLPAFAEVPRFAASIAARVAEIDGQPTPDNVLTAIEASSEATTLLIFFISTKIGLPGGMLSSYEVAESISACTGDVVIFDLASDIGMIGNLKKYLPAGSSVLEYDSLKTIPHRTYGGFADLRQQVSTDADMRWADLCCTENPGAPRFTLYQGQTALKDARRIPQDHMFFDPIVESLGVR
jgi:hypothetical protein